MDVTVHAWLLSQHKTFYSEVIKQIVWRWIKCIVKQGDCVEKLCGCKISALAFINMRRTVRIIIDSPLYIERFCKTIRRHLQWVSRINTHVGSRFAELSRRCST